MTRALVGPWLTVWLRNKVHKSPGLWTLPAYKGKENCLANVLIEITLHLINSNLPIPSHFNFPGIGMHTDIDDKKVLQSSILLGKFSLLPKIIIQLKMNSFRFAEI